MRSIVQYLSRALHVIVGHRHLPGASEMSDAAVLKRRLDQLSVNKAGTALASIPGLDSHFVSDETIVLSAPTLRQGTYFADACLRRDVRRVVDLRSAKEKTRGEAGPLDGPVQRMGFLDRSGRSGLSASFEREGRKSALNAMGARTPAPDARASRVVVRLVREGKTLGPDGNASPDHAQVLQLIRMPTGGGGAVISPRRLFDVSLHLALTKRSGGATVFQCADGGRTGATFAAASGLMQRFLRGEIDPHRVDEAVVNECLRLSPGPSHPFRTEDLASLVAFAKLMVEAGARGGLPAITRASPPPKPQRAWEHVRRVLPPAMRAIE